MSDKTTTEFYRSALADALAKVKELEAALRQIRDTPERCGYETDEPLMHSEDMMLDMRDHASQALGE